MPFGLIAAGISAGGSLLGGLMGGDAATSAAKTQANATNRATDVQIQQYLDVANKLKPYLQGGESAFNTLIGGLGIQPDLSFDMSKAPLLQDPAANLGPTPGSYDLSRFQASPGYNYQLQQSNNAIENSSVGRTGALSGNMLKALQTNSMGLANQDWWTSYNANADDYWKRYAASRGQQGDVFSRLFSIAGAGQNAAVQQGGFGQNAANQIGQNIVGAGDATAAGQVGSAKAIGGGITGALTNLMSPNSGTNSFASMLRNLFAGGSGGGGGGGGAPGYSY